jgi:predicted enzyme related to lactoylglutathione lyase
MSDTPVHAGRFVWHDLMSRDTAKAIPFYRQLVGWTTREMDTDGGRLTIFSTGDTDVGDIVALDGAPGAPSHWTCYISVDDVDAAAKAVESLGGQVVSPPEDTPPWGRVAGVKDAGGAFFRAFQGAGAPPEEAPAWPPKAGTFCWCELLTPDVDQAADFYQRVVGWRPERAMEMPEGGAYYLFKRGEDNAAGMMNMTMMPPGVQVPNWLPYIAVDDMAATTARVAGLGGTVLVEPRQVPGTGEFSIIQDPAGAVVALFTAEPMPAGS